MPSGATAIAVNPPVPSGPFAGRVAIVTGAASGIGRATAQRLMAGGARVLAADLTLIQDALSSTSSNSAQMIGHVVDVADAKSIGAMVAQAVAELGAIDMLVNAAGVQQTRAIEAITVADWDWVMDVNLRGTFLCIQAVTPYMPSGGAIVNISSTSGRSGRAFAAHYASSKMGVISLTRSCALALGPGIRVNAVCPGVTNTPMWDEIDKERAKLFGYEVGAARRELVAQVPLRRACEPEEIAATAAFLLSDDAAYITGQSINVDGGLEMD